MGDTCFRYDVAPIEKYETTPEGYLRAWATIARTGVQMYTDVDGSIRREYRPETEVASPESLTSFGGKAITFEHPPILLDAQNTKQYQIGFTGTDIIYDDGFVRAVMTITDQEAIDRIMRGDAKEVSAGYRVEYDPTPGITENGEHYDGIQKSISGNHVAVVRRGRAGPQVKLHLDRLDAADPSLISLIEEPSMTAKVVFDGAEFEVSESVALAITKEREDAKMSYDMMKKKYDELMAEASKLKEDMSCMQKEMKGKADSAEGRADALSEEIESLKVELDAAREINLDSLVEERVALIDKARVNLDSDFDFSGKSAREIMESAVKAVRGDADLSEKSDDYVTAMFDTLSEVAKRNDSPETEELRKAVSTIANPAVNHDSYWANVTSAWKNPLATSKEAR